MLAEVARKVDPCIECEFLGVAQSGTCRTDVAAEPQSPIWPHCLLKLLIYSLDVGGR